MEISQSLDERRRRRGRRAYAGISTLENFTRASSQINFLSTGATTVGSFHIPTIYSRTAPGLSMHLLYKPKRERESRHSENWLAYSFTSTPLCCCCRSISHYRIFLGLPGVCTLLYFFEGVFSHYTTLWELANCSAVWRRISWLNALNLHFQSAFTSSSLRGNVQRWFFIYVL